MNTPGLISWHSAVVLFCWLAGLFIVVGAGFAGARVKEGMNQKRPIRKKFFVNYLWVGLFLVGTLMLVSYYGRSNPVLVTVFLVNAIVLLVWAFGLFAMIGFVDFEDKNNNGND